jgi:hypothetical protein
VFFVGWVGVFFRFFSVGFGVFRGVFFVFFFGGGGVGFGGRFLFFLGAVLRGVEFLFSGMLFFLFFALFFCFFSCIYRKFIFF